MRPTFLLGTDEGPWTEEDRLLALALQEHEDGLCSCGYPINEAWGDLKDGDFQVVVRHCEACATRERWNPEDAKTTSKHGRKAIVVRTPEDGPAAAG